MIHKGLRRFIEKDDAGRLHVVPKVRRIASFL